MDAPRPRISGLAVTFLLAFCLLGIIFFVQTFIITAGGRGWPEYSIKYELLAQAFLHGQVSLLEKPSPRLLAAKDPYDNSQSWMFRDPKMHDAVLFEGKYYIYWGPVPSLLIAAGAFIAHQPMPHFGDEFVTWPFLFGTLILTLILSQRIKTLYFPELPRWSIAPGILSLGLGTPMLFTLARAAVYEAAIAGGQFFLLAGICSALEYFRKPRASLLALTGISWTLAIGCRISLVPAIGVLTLLTARRIWQSLPRSRPPVAMWKPIAAMIAPLAIGGVLFAWYNFIRFHSILEFGQRYQLATTETHRLGSADFLALSHLPPNLYRYFLASPLWQSTFPFVFPQYKDPAFYHRFGLPSDYGMEPCAGLIWTQPFLIFAALSCYWGFSRQSPTEDRGLKMWLFLTLWISLLLGLAPVLPMIGSTMRYLMDFVPAATILATIGFWQTLRWTRTKPALRTALCSAVFLLVIGQAIIGSLLAVTGYYGHFKTFNPDLYNRLVAHLSI